MLTIQEHQYWALQKTDYSTHHLSVFLNQIPVKSFEQNNKRALETDKKQGYQTEIVQGRRRSIHGLY